jgi:tRNA A37 threonylcarbamoyladenosine modification protein TsaB
MLVAVTQLRMFLTSLVETELVVTSFMKASRRKVFCARYPRCGQGIRRPPGETGAWKSLFSGRWGKGEETVYERRS